MRTGAAVDVHWRRQSRQETVNLELLVLPTVIETTLSSCTYRACDTSSLNLNIAKLHDSSWQVTLHIICEVPDNLEANAHKKAAFSERLPANAVNVREPRVRGPPHPSHHCRCNRRGQDPRRRPRGVLHRTDPAESPDDERQRSSTVSIANGPSIGRKCSTTIWAESSSM